MKKWMNTMFFGSCFIAAILIEAYGMVLWEGNPYSVIALGVVVLITGYLFMDSIRSILKNSSEGAKFYMDKLLSEEAEKWSERHTEILNLQKASYTATKKNAILLTEQFEEVLLRMEALENNNTKTLQKIIELQKKSLEGQKNALNLEINYNKENTKRIIGVLKEEEKNNDTSDQISRILNAIEENNQLLKEQMSYGKRNINHIDPYDDLSDITQEENTYVPQLSQAGFTEDIGFDEELDYEQHTDSPEDSLGDTFSEINADVLLKDLESLIINEESYNKDFYEELGSTDHIEDAIQEDEVLFEENTSESDWSLQEEPEPEVINPMDEIGEPEKKVVPLYADPNKSLTADEIAALFASFGS